MKQKEWTPKAVRRLREALGLSQANFAELVGVRENTVWRWEAGYAMPEPLAVRQLEAVELSLRKKARRKKV